ncbi:MAG: ATP-binding cassette domain-containing protein [Bacilli bacterium]|nr:ATP-binding cassette domain-containing protein [Bacilli bacterium]
MGWFEDQVKKRQQLDERTFEDSFLSLAGVQATIKDRKDEIALRENYALAQILAYYHQPNRDIPAGITEFTEKVAYALRPMGVSYHKVEIDESWIEDNTAPLLVFTKANHTPVVLFPRGNKGYYYHHFKTGKKEKISKVITEKLEPTAYRFYRPLPSEKMSIKEYFRYLRKSSRPIDAFLTVVMTAAVSGIGLLLPYLTKKLTGDVAQSKDLNMFLVFAVYVVGVATGSLLLQSLKGFLSLRITIRREKSIQEATMMRVLSLPPAFFKQYNTGELTVRFNSVPTLATTIVNGVFMTGVSSAMSLAYLFQLSSFVPVLIVPVILILLTSTAFTVLVAVVQKNHTRRQLAMSSKESGVTYELINGIQKVRLSGSEKRVFAKWASAYSKAVKLKYRPPLILRLSTAITLLITLIGAALIYAVAATNDVDAPNYMAFLTSYGILSAAFASLGQMVGVFSTIQPLYELARPILTAPAEETENKLQLSSIGGNIRVEDLSFQYNENGPWILDHLNLDIKEGEYIAIVGQTGCGKSTFVRMLLGFEKPTQGHIYYDDIDMEGIDLSSLRRNIGTVMQNGALFHADILSNIIISAPHLGEKEAWEAAEVANIAEDIREMPMGMKTVISEGQGSISGGQKQRIMIARAIVHKPKILIFDEATSALDNMTQKSISDSIAQLHCTRIVIAHRLSTIQQADRILMLEGGKIIESGDYQTLIEKKGRFAELVARQRLDIRSKE